MLIAKNAILKSILNVNSKWLLNNSLSKLVTKVNNYNATNFMAKAGKSKDICILKTEYF